MISEVNEKMKLTLLQKALHLCYSSLVYGLLEEFSHSLFHTRARTFHALIAEGSM